jgi:hypothetical protein
VNALAAQTIQQALMAASHNQGGRARAISVLRGSEVYAATWPMDATSLRTLLNSSGLQALALFTDERQLEEAAVRFGWLNVDGTVPTRRLNVAEAIRFARQRKVSLVVIDITADHALELDDGDLELVAAPASGRPPSVRSLAPVMSAALHGSAGTEVNRVSTRPPPVADETRPKANSLSSSGLRPSSVNVDLEHHAVSATFGAARTATMTALTTAPTDALIVAFTQVLRGYCEVEWACLVGEAERAEALSVVLRIEPALRTHMAEISAKLRRAAAEQNASCDVLVLDTADQIKRARIIGLPFYPWRKRPSLAARD